MEMFLPPVQPSLLSSCRNAATRTWLPEALVLSKYPMRKILLACCASAPADPNANVRTVARIPANFGYFDIAQYRFSIVGRKHENVGRVIPVSSCVPNLKSKIENPKFI